MVVVALIGVLAAIAIQSYIGYVNKTKSTEAELQLDRVRKQNAAHYQTNSSYPLQGTATAMSELVIGKTPTVDCCTQNYEGKKRCKDDVNAWQAWSALGVVIGEPHHFQYSYVGGDSTLPAAGGLGQKYTVVATGDVDCDGESVVYRLEGGNHSGIATSRVTRPGSRRL